MITGSDLAPRPEITIYEDNVPSIATKKVGEKIKLIGGFTVAEKTKSFIVLKFNYIDIVANKRVV